MYDGCSASLSVEDTTKHGTRYIRYKTKPILGGVISEHFLIVTRYKCVLGSKSVEIWLNFKCLCKFFSCSRCEIIFVLQLSVI